MTSRICILALSIFIHAVILALLPRWDSAAARLEAPRETPIRVALYAPRTPEPSADDALPGADVTPSPEKAMERPEARNETPSTAAPDAEMVRTADPSSPEPERSIDPAPKPRQDVRPAKKPAPRRRIPERRTREAHVPPASLPDSRPSRQVPVAPVESAGRAIAEDDPWRPARTNPASDAPGDGAERILSISEASPVRRTPPGYPLASRVRGEEGTAVLIAQVANGRVLSVAIETSSGFDRLDAAARFAVLRWTFASKEPLRVRIPVSFRLTDVK